MRASPTFLTLASTLLSLSPAAVEAHGHVRGISVNGKGWTPGADPVWYYYAENQRPVTAGWNALNQDNGFVEPASVGSADVICHKSATAGKAYVNANAGDSVTFYWNTWPDSHKGPIINYIAPCNGECTSASASSLRWQKISQSALLNPSTNTWATDTLISQNFTSTLPLPRNLAPGNYVIRHEIIALHGAQSDNGAQLYPQCLNFKIGGSGKAMPSGGVAGTALYKRNEPGIVFNLYTNPQSYTFPGPALYTGAN